MGSPCYPRLLAKGSNPSTPISIGNFMVDQRSKQSSVRAGEWKLVRLYQDDGTWKEEPYNLYADPAEQVDATHYPTVVARLVSYAGVCPLNQVQTSLPLR